MELPFELVYTPKELDLNEFPERRDEKDSPILATAIMEGIDVFLTGDKDFLVLDVETPEILTMKVRVANPMQSRCCNIRMCMARSVHKIFTK